MDSPRPDGILLPSAFADAVLTHLERKFQGLHNKPATEIHNETLSEFPWADIKSSDTCFVCLARVPQYIACCGHSFCENCLVVYGDADDNDPWLLLQRCCILCQEEVEMAVRVRPPTAGQSILCIDGGGVRGILPLMMLVSLQEKLDLPIPIQELFNLSYGTSVGTSASLLDY